MCGINGILGDDAHPVDPDELLRTREQMRHRGPDGSGMWIAPGGQVGLAHRRLAILDPTAKANQPMTSPDGRFRIVYNGEIYNFRELRNELARDGLRFHTESDTEVLLALYSRFGLDMLPRLRGMYAFAIWDEVEQRLVLARDPLGIKPLYYSMAGGCLRFASQVKALLAGGGVPEAIDPAGLVGFLLWGSVPEPFTIRRAIRALPAGHSLTAMPGVTEAPRPQPGLDAGSARFTSPDVVTALAGSVEAHLVSDVPVAVFLSAGLDSTLIAALAARHHRRSLTTFTLSFDLLEGGPLDEAPLAAAVARTLGTRHLQHRLSRDDFLGLWPEALAAMDQPSIDGFNVFVVSRAASDAGIKVALTGLGGDELFGSYPSFADVARWFHLTRRVPRRPAVTRAWAALARRLAPHRPKLAGLLRYGSTLPGAYFLRRALFLPEELPRLLGEALAEEGLAAYDPIADAGKSLPAMTGYPGEPREIDPWIAVHWMESTQYMRNQLLRDADWAAMAHSVELRVPLADVSLRAALAADHFAEVRAAGKAGLVRRLAPELPQELFQRPKSGFYIPVAEWLSAGTGRPTAQRRGEGSRQLAQRVLQELGVELRAV